MHVALYAKSGAAWRRARYGASNDHIAGAGRQRVLYVRDLHSVRENLQKSRTLCRSRTLLRWVQPLVGVSLTRLAGYDYSRQPVATSTQPSASLSRSRSER